MSQALGKICRKDLKVSQITVYKMFSGIFRERLMNIFISGINKIIMALTIRIFTYYPVYSSCLWCARSLSWAAQALVMAELWTFLMTSFSWLFGTE